MVFPRLQKLAAAENSNNLTDVMSVFIQRNINNDLQFSAGLSHLWEVLYSSVQEHKLLIAELNVFGGPLALQCAEFLKWGLSHPAKAETRGVTSWISSQHNGVNNRETLNA
ncbi:hypothetical protein Tco_0695194 [Tanacetum coccineum]